MSNFRTNRASCGSGPGVMPDYLYMFMFTRPSYFFYYSTDWKYCDLFRWIIKTRGSLDAILSHGVVVPSLTRWVVQSYFNIAGADECPTIHSLKLLAITLSDVETLVAQINRNGCEIFHNQITILISRFPPWNTTSGFSVSVTKLLYLSLSNCGRQRSKGLCLKGVLRVQHCRYARDWYLDRCATEPENLERTWSWELGVVLCVSKIFFKMI